MKQKPMFRYLFAVVALLAITMSGCVPAQPGGASAPAGPPLRTGKDLKILYWQAPTILNPHQAAGTKDYDAAIVILEPLASYTEKDVLVPKLATEIPTVENGGVAADGTSITWKLKEGVKWSDGSDFTAEDVILTWQYCSTPETACTNLANYDDIESVEAVDATTVKVTWKAATGNPYVAFVGPLGQILQKAQFENCVGTAAATEKTCQEANLAPIGTGAWKLKSFKPGDVVLYEKNDLYRDAANVYFDTVEMKGGGDAASAGRAVCETGEYDYAWNLQVPKAVLDPILAAGGCDAVAGGSFGIERLEFNFANPDPALGEERSEPDQPHPFLSDIKVRQAIAMAIDKQAIVDQLYGPTGFATCNFLVVPAPLNSTNTKCDRDVEGAKKLLDDAGFVDSDGDGTREANGVPMRMSYQTTINPLRQGEQAIVKSNLAEIGIVADLKAIDAGVFFSGDEGNPDTLNKFYADIQMFTNGPSDPDPSAYFDGWTCSKVNSSENLWQGGNASRYCNEEYDALYATYLGELDPVKRAELLIQMNDFLINDFALIPLISRVTPQGKVKNLEGPTYSTFDSVLWNLADWKRK